MNIFKKYTDINDLNKYFEKYNLIASGISYLDNKIPEYEITIETGNIENVRDFVWSEFELDKSPRFERYDAKEGKFFLMIRYLAVSFYLPQPPNI
jgi:hypothetical protein